MVKYSGILCYQLVRLLNANYNIEMQIQLNTSTDIGHLMLIGENSKTSL